MNSVRAAAKSAIDAYRSSALRAIAVRQISSNRGGVSGRNSLGRDGGFIRMAVSMLTVLPVNGRRPVRTS
jgi:hypothetical protein